MPCMCLSSHRLTFAPKLRVRSFIVHALQQLATSDAQRLTPDALATAAVLLRQCATFATPLQVTLRAACLRSSATG